MKIIGWTDYSNPKYENMFPFGGTQTWQEVNKVEELIAKEVREKGYKFTGDYHQNGDYGAPVFDNGKMYKGSQRDWGGIMAMAYPEEHVHDGYEYCRWAWICPADEDFILPSENERIETEW